MRTSQLEQLDTLILQWHRKHPDIELVSYVRFDDFAASRGKSIVAEVAEGGGFLAPVGEATKAVDEVRLLGERAFYLGKRMPFLLSWQVREALGDALNSPDLAQINAIAPTITASVERATRIAERLPADIAREREAVDAMFAKHMPLVDKTLLMTPRHRQRQHHPRHRGHQPLRIGRIAAGAARPGAARRCSRRSARSTTPS